MAKVCDLLFSILLGIPDLVFYAMDDAMKISVDGQDGDVVARSSGIRLVEPNDGLALVRVCLRYCVVELSPFFGLVRQLSTMRFKGATQEQTPF